MDTDRTYSGSVSFEGSHDSFIGGLEHLPVVNEISEEFQGLDGEYISDVVELLSTFTENETSDSNFAVCRLAVNNKIKPDEIYLMETMFENDLESLSKDGVKIFEIDGCLDIRNKGVQKHLSHEDRERLEEHLVDDSDNSDDSDFGFDYTGFDPTTTTSGYNITTSGSKLESDTIEASLEEVTIEVDGDETYSLMTEHDH